MTPEERTEDLIRKHEFYDDYFVRKPIADAIRAAVAEEREACAKIVEQQAPGDDDWKNGRIWECDDVTQMVEFVANRIRSGEGETCRT